MCLLDVRLLRIIMPRPQTAAVVGAGAAGLVAARELLGEGINVVVFERSSRVGGIWAFDPDPEHGSLYESLRTNLPRELMAFSGCGLAGRVFAGDERTFPGHPEMLAFLNKFAEESDIARHVRLQAEVVRIMPLGNAQDQGWTVVWRGEDGEVAEVFDSVVVCNGHHMAPFVPKIHGIGNWRGKQMHSHSYRNPEPFQDEKVLVIGFGPSGADITREISHVAKEVHIASRYTQKLGMMETYKNVWMHTEVDCIQDDGKVHFAEGSTLAADVILYCTGCRYDFPFIELDGFSVDDNRVGPLFKHVLPPKYAPSLSFIGIPIRNILFQTYELQSKWVAHVLSGRAAVPSEEVMLASVHEHYQAMEDVGRAKRHTHVLMPEWVEYMNWLADQVGEPHLVPQRCNVYEKALMCVWSGQEGYRDKWDEDQDGEELCHSLVHALASKLI